MKISGLKSFFHLCLALVFFSLPISCGGGGGAGSPTKIKGAIFNPQQLPIATNPNIELQGRANQEFPLSFKETESASSLIEFEMNGLPKEEQVVFKIFGAGIDTVLTFPVAVESGRSYLLPVISSGTFDAIKSQAVAHTGIPQFTDLSQFEDDRATVGGMIEPMGGGCASITRVELLNRSDGSPAPGEGPFYLNNSGQITTANSFQDDQCTFIFFNVAPGLYYLRILDAGSNVVGLPVEAVALEGLVTFGFDLN